MCGKRLLNTQKSFYFTINYLTLITKSCILFIGIGYRFLGREVIGMTTKYNLRGIMRNAWKFYNYSKENGLNETFSESLKRAWRNAKIIENAKIEACLKEESHTWYSWKELGYVVIHGSIASMKVVVEDTKTKSGTKTLSYFTKSQVA